MINLIFGAFIFIWVLYAFFILYHFVRFGIGQQPKILAFWFLLGSFLFLSLMVGSFINIDWNNLKEYVSNFLLLK
ncbi:MAG: hypothetical protein ACPL3E_01935 [Minisyncoccia bacterium]